MNLDTQLEEDQRQRAEQQIGSASDAQLAQMHGEPVPQDDYTPPDWSQGAMGVQVAPDAPIPTAQDAGAPPPLPPPAPIPQTPVDLLAQVQAGQISRPAVDKAFGPPPTPAPELQGLDWGGLADRLSGARQRAATGHTIQTVFANAANPGKYVEDSHAGDDEVAGAEDELKLGQAKHAMGVQDAQEADRKAQLGRQVAGDDWRQLHERMQLTQQAQQAADRLRAEQALRQMNGEEKAVADQRAERALDEQRRAHDLEHGDRAAAIGERADASKLKAKKGMGGPPAPVLHEGELDKVPEDIRSNVKAIINGQGPIPSSTVKDPQQKAIRKMVYQLKPDFDEAAYGLRTHTIQHIATEKDVSAIPVAIHHLQLARDAINSTTSLDSPTLNKIYQAVVTGAGSDQFSGQAFALKVAADEVATVYKLDSEKGKEMMQTLFNPSSSKPQKLRVLDEAEEFLRGKVQGVQSNIDRVDPNHVSGFKISAPEKVGGEVTVKNKRTGASRKMAAADAEKYRNQDGYEVQ